MNYMISKLQRLPKFQEYVQRIKEKNSPITISGLSDVGKIQFLYATKESVNRPICIVTYNEMQARKIIKDLNYFTEEEICYFPKREIATYDYIAESKDLPYERIEVLNKIQEKNAKIIVTTAEAIMQKMITKTSLYKNCIHLEVGKGYSLENIKETLVLLGYERNDLVESRGQFSVRGDIVDIAISEKEGVRIEFWGDEIDSIRKFSVISQRSNDMLEKINIMPAHEFVLEDDLKAVIKRIKASEYNIKDNRQGKINLKQKEEYSKKIQEIVRQDIELIESGDYISKIDKYFNAFYTKKATFFDYLEKDFILLFDEFSKIKQREESILIDYKNLIKTLVEKERYVLQSIDRKSVV